MKDTIKDTGHKLFDNKAAAWNEIGYDDHLAKARKQDKDLKFHKYKRGHLMIVAGNRFMGAAILAAKAAAASGAGLITMHAYKENLESFKGYAASKMPNIMVRGSQDNLQTPDLMADSLAGMAQAMKLDSALIGPGQGVSQKTAAQSLQLLEQDIRVVLDADVFSSFENNTEILIDALSRHYKRFERCAVLTPHEGEFAKIFPKLTEDKRDKSPDESAQSKKGKKAREAKAHRALAAAQEACAIVILKGASTVIALPDGRAFINNAPMARLAVGGTGDVLAGSIASLLAQAYDPALASCVGVWMHSQAAKNLDYNFTPQDLAEQIARLV